MLPGLEKACGIGDDDWSTMNAFHEKAVRVTRGTISVNLGNDEMGFLDTEVQD